MGGAPNLRAFCSQARRFAFPDREGGCHQLCGFGFLARKCKHRPLPPGGRRGQTRQKTERKTSPPRGLCGTDRWLPHAAPPRDPLNVAGARTLLGPPGRGQGSVLLSGAFPADAQVLGEPGLWVRRRELQTPKTPARRDRERGWGAAVPHGHPAPSGHGRGNPARPPPSAHGPCRAAGPGRAPRRDSAGCTWCRRTGPRPPSCSSASSSTAARSEAGPHGELGRRRRRRPGRAGSSSSPALGLAPTRPSPPEPEAPRPQPSPSASTSAPAHPVTPSQPLPLRPRERRRETKRGVSLRFSCAAADPLPPRPPLPHP